MNDYVSVRDLNMMYSNSLVMWKNTPVYVFDIGEDYRFEVFNLETQKVSRLKWIPDNFTAPTTRIGYVNLGTNCAYLQRSPVRRYKVGLSRENVNSTPSIHPLSAVESIILNDILRSMRHPQLYAALVGNYPTLEEAQTLAKENEGVVAFDRQFAVSHGDNILYKGELVGMCVDGNILFHSGKEHLSRALLSR